MRTAGSPDSFLRAFTSDTSLGLGRKVLERSDVDWIAAGYDGEARDALVEYMVRVVQSLFVDPLDPSRSSAARSFDSSARERVPAFRCMKPSS